MKKSVIILLFLAFICQVSSAQTFVAAGTVGSQQGLRLRYAFVYDKQSKNATYTDSPGNFKLSVNQGAQLTITCKGYIESTINVTGQQPLNVTSLPALSALCPKNP